MYKCDAGKCWKWACVLTKNTREKNSEQSCRNLILAQDSLLPHTCSSQFTPSLCSGYTRCDTCRNLKILACWCINICMFIAAPLEHHGTGWTDSPACRVLAREQQWWVMGLVETVGWAQCYPAPEEWDSWKSPRPAAPQTDPCWLRTEATWRHGERPADSWGTGRCHGNRGSSLVTPTRPRAGQQSCYELGKVRVCKSRKPWCWATPRWEYV